MTNLLLDKEHRSVLEQISQGKSVYVNCQDDLATVHLLVSAIYQEIEQGNPVKINIEDGNLKALLLASLDTSGLSHLVLGSDQTIVSPETSTKLRVISKQKTAPIQGNDRSLFERYFNKIEAYCAAKSKQIFGSKSWRDIVELKSFRGQSKERLFLNRLDVDFQYNQNEYWNLKKMIESAAQKWNPIYEQINSQELFRPELALDGAKISKILKDRKASLIDVLDQIKRTLEGQVADIESKFEAEYLSILEKKDALEDQVNLLLKTSKHSKGLFKAKTSIDEKIHQFLKKAFKDNILIDASLIDCTDPSMIMLQIDEQLQTWKSNMDVSIEKHLKRLNKHNVADSTYKAIDDRLTAILKTINEDQIFNFHFDNTAHNITLQLAYIKKVVDIINRAVWVADMAGGYFVWMQFYQALDLSQQKLVQALIQFTDDQWMDGFESWYLHHLVKHHSDPTSKLDDINLQEMLHLYEDILMQERDIVKKAYETRLSLLLDSIKKNNKALYKELVKQTNHSLLLEDIQLAQEDIVDVLYPIQLGLSSGNSDCLNITDINPPNENKRFVLGINIPVPKSPRISLKADINLDGPLSECPLSRRLSVGYALSHHIYNYSKQIRVFILKDRTVITCLSDLMNKKHLHPIKDSIIKEVIINSDPIERLTEQILQTDIPIELWIEDIVINTAAPSMELVFQSKLILSIQTAGIHVVRLNTSTASTSIPEPNDTEVEVVVAANEEGIEVN